MTADHPMMVGAATVFVVSDIAKSVEYYRDVLGFKVTFQYGKPTFYACLCRDEVALHLLASRETKRLPGNGGICGFVGGVELGGGADLALVGDVFLAAVAQRMEAAYPAENARQTLMARRLSRLNISTAPSDDHQLYGPVALLQGLAGVVLLIS